METNLEIIEKNNDISYEAAQVSFPAYEEYKEKAEAVAEYINGIELTDDNVKEVKTTLASAKKLTDRLARIRIDMKREILKNYSAFEAQVKEISNIVGDADASLRAKVREKEDRERIDKEHKLQMLFYKRAEQYPLVNRDAQRAFNFWLEPSFLNKTRSMKANEANMVEWLEKTNRDMQTAFDMGEDYLAAYYWHMDLGDAIKAVNQHKEAVEELGDLLEDPDLFTETKQMTFIVYGDDDIRKTEDLLSRNNINYIIY